MPHFIIVLIPYINLLDLFLSNMEPLTLMPCLPGVSGSLNPFMPNALFYLYTSDRSIFYIRGVWLVFINAIFLKKFLYLMQTV